MLSLFPSFTFNAKEHFALPHTVTLRDQAKYIVVLPKEVVKAGLHEGDFYLYSRVWRENEKIAQGPILFITDNAVLFQTTDDHAYLPDKIYLVEEFVTFMDDRVAFEAIQVIQRVSLHLLLPYEEILFDRVCDLQDKKT